MPILDQGSPASTSVQNNSPGFSTFNKSSYTSPSVHKIVEKFKSAAKQGSKSVSNAISGASSDQIVYPDNELLINNCKNTSLDNINSDRWSNLSGIEVLGVTDTSEANNNNDQVSVDLRKSIKY